MENIVDARGEEYFSAISQNFTDFLPFARQLGEVKRITDTGPVNFDVLDRTGLLNSFILTTGALDNRVLRPNAVVTGGVPPSEREEIVFRRRRTMANIFGLQIRIPAIVSSDLSFQASSSLASGLMQSFEETVYSIIFQSGVRQGPTTASNTAGSVHGTQQISLATGDVRRLLNYGGTTNPNDITISTDPLYRSNFTASTGLTRANLLTARDTLMARAFVQLSAPLYFMADLTAISELVNANPEEVSYVETRPGHFLPRIHNITMLPVLTTTGNRGILFTPRAFGIAMSSPKSNTHRDLSRADASTLSFFFYCGAAVLREREIQVISHGTS